MVSASPRYFKVAGELALGPGVPIYFIQTRFRSVKNATDAKLEASQILQSHKCVVKSGEALPRQAPAFFKGLHKTDRDTRLDSNPTGDINIRS